MPDPIPTLQIVINRGLAYGQEHESIAQALQTLGIDPNDLEHDHPLIDLYQAIRSASTPNNVVYLSYLQRFLLAEAIAHMKREQMTEATKPLRQQATAARLRFMVHRSVV